MVLRHAQVCVCGVYVYPFRTTKGVYDVTYCPRLLKEPDNGCSYYMAHICAAAACNRSSICDKQFVVGKNSYYLYNDVIGLNVTAAVNCAAH